MSAELSPQVEGINNLVPSVEDLNQEHVHGPGQALPFPRNVLQADGYYNLLRWYGLDPAPVDFHWQVGRIGRTQGWLLDISIVRSQIVEALQGIIPLMISGGIPFRLVKDHDTAVTVLDGNLGREYLGKILTIYPESDEQAVALAKELIEKTAAFKGPAVLTDIHLGGNVYTRYGGFNPVTLSDAGGNIQQFIYDQNENLVPDVQPIPFVMPVALAWPFGSLALPQAPGEKKILHGIYRPLALLKSDPRGNVIKAFYLTSHLWVRTCVIKQAKRDMWSDDHGRDMADRLRWQQELYRVLAGSVRMPKILDLFEEDGDVYLAMEFVKGQSVFDYISEKVNPNSEWFVNWPRSKQLEAIGYLIKIAGIVQVLHGAGVVHRDITPVNFLIDGKKELVLIDNELAHSIKLGAPDPPFQFGTHGFMSPEQTAVKTPTAKEDIYGLGATLISVLTGVPPIVFDVSRPEHLKQNLSHFIPDAELAAMTATCLSLDPQRRPAANQVAEVMASYRDQLPDKNMGTVQRTERPDKGLIREIIQGAMRGLITQPMMIHKGLWQTRKKSMEQSADRPNQGFAKSGGYYEGIAGVLYTIAEAKLAGFDVGECEPVYQKNLAFLRERYLNELPHLPPGLSGGAAGMAMALASGMATGLIEPDADNKRLIQACFEIPHAGQDMADGLAGQGMAALYCGNYLDADFQYGLLAKITQFLLEQQDKNGNWMMLRTGNKKPETAILFNQGNTGINLFLLECYSLYKRSNSESMYPELWKAIQGALEAFRGIHPSIKQRYEKAGFRGHLLDVQLKDGFKGLILNYLKAFAVSGDLVYKELAEELLSCYPRNIVHEDLTLQNGLAGIGELYLEAYRLFRNREWWDRAEWIGSLFEHTSYVGRLGNRYWLTNNQTLPAADFMTGNAGIIYFLIEFYKDIIN